MYKTKKKNCIKNKKLKNSNIFNENDKHCEKQKKKHIIIDSVYIIEDIIFIRKLLKNFIVLFKKNIIKLIEKKISSPKLSNPPHVHISKKKKIKF